MMILSFLYFLALTQSEPSAAVVSDIIEATQISSHSNDESGLKSMAEWFISKLNPLGYQGEWNSKTRLLVLKRPVAHPRLRITLIGHLDTVYHEPREPELTPDQRLIASGSIDAKGGLVQIIEIAKALDHSAIKDHLELTIIAQGDEEIFSRFSSVELRKAAELSDVILVYEPGWRDQNNPNRIYIPTAVGGNLIVKAEVQRQTFHPGIGTQLGRNAADTLIDMAIQVRELRREGISVHLSNLHSLSARNVTSPRGIFRASLRYSSYEDRNKIIRLLVEMRKQKLIYENAQLQWFDQWTPHKLSMDIHLWQALHDSAQEQGWLISPETTRTHDASSFLKFKNIPVLTSMGPFGESPHNPEESIDLSTFKRRIELSCSIILKMLVKKLN